MPATNRPIPLWKRARYRVEWAGVRALATIVPRLPRGLCHALADAAGTLFYLLDARSRRVALANLEAAFGDRFQPRERRRIARASLRNMARTMFDLFWVTNLGAGNYQRFLKQQNAGIASELPRRTGIGAILYCHHFGNWEWLIQSTGFAGAEMVFVAQEFKNTLLDDVFRRLREHAGCRQISRHGALLRLVKSLKAGVSTGLLVDLTVPPGQSAVVIDTFGLKMCVTSAPAALRRRIGCQLVPNVSLPQPDGTIRALHLQPLELPADASDQQVAQACWDRLEPYIHQHPELWLWVYKHWRYRPRDADPERYPFYANQSASFERLLAESRGNRG